MEEDPASAAEVYDTSRFSDLYHASRSPSPQHLGLAARFLVSLFRGHSVFFAFLGGWAVYLRGGGRRTEDVDVSVAISMGSLTEILMREERCDEPLILFFSYFIPASLPLLSGHSFCIRGVGSISLSAIRIPCFTYAVT